MTASAAQLQGDLAKVLGPDIQVVLRPSWSAKLLPRGKKVSVWEDPEGTKVLDAFRPKGYVDFTIRGVEHSENGEVVLAVKNRDKTGYIRLVDFFPTAKGKDLTVARKNAWFYPGSLDTHESIPLGTVVTVWCTANPAFYEVEWGKRRGKMRKSNFVPKTK
jgi:hypothetical protein